MTKKRFISVIIVLSVLTSILMLGVTSASAVSKPTLYAPTNIKGGQRVTWSHAGASRAGDLEPCRRVEVLPIFRRV